MRTWHAELAVVVAVLAGLTLASHGGLADWIAAVAIATSFAHAQVSDRLAEREAARDRVTVECHARASEYYAAKEVAWVVAFAMRDMWTAVIGAVLFASYPAWRRWWRSRHPMQRAS